MDKKNLYSIGETARMFHLSVSSLHHYERQGLITPQYTDPVTGYRYYSTRQFEVLNTIRYLRVLDMPLEEIKAFLCARDVEVIEEKLRKQKEVVVAKRWELLRIERKIDHRLQQLADASASLLDTVYMEEKQECRLVQVRDSLQIEDFFDMEAPIRRLDTSGREAVVFLGKVGVGISKERLIEGQFCTYDRIFLVLDDEDDFGGEVSNLPKANCVSIRFRGCHAQAAPRYEELLAFIRAHDLRINGFSREITLIDYGFTNDTGKFVTEISIPVEPQQSTTSL